MRRFVLIALAASSAMATVPAQARDDSFYVGVEGGILFAKDTNLFGRVTQFGTVARSAQTNELFVLDYKKGIDADIVAGYDFGPLRLELEGGYKRAGIDTIDVRPQVGGVTGTTTIANISQITFGAPVTLDASGKITGQTAMANMLLDFGGNQGLGLYAGAGIGRGNFKLSSVDDSSGRTYTGKDSAWAWQVIAGARYPITANIDIGLKYRYFHSGTMKFDDINRTANVAFPCGITSSTVLIPTGSCTRRVNSTGRFVSQSLMASLIFNFGAPAAPPPPPPPAPPPPPPPPPATQTCPDGSVILATDSCPLPPPPPPPPPPAPERG